MHLGETVNTKDREIVTTAREKVHITYERRHVSVNEQTFRQQ